MVGRPYKVVYAGTVQPFSQSFYNAVGQLWKEQDPDGIITFYTYNAKGEREYTITAVSGSARLVANYDALLQGLSGLKVAGIDRITRVVNDAYYSSSYSVNAKRTQTFVWASPGDMPARIQLTEASADGLKTWNSIINGGIPATTSTETSYSTSGYRWVKTTQPSMAYSIDTFRNGRLVTTEQWDSANTIVSSVSYSYDTHGRQTAVTDLRNGTTTYQFNYADQIRSVTPPPASGPPAPPSPTTTYVFDNMGRVTETDFPDSTSQFQQYFPNGLVKKTWGSRTYAVEYTYDAQGRVKTMKTWKNFAQTAGAATTTWNYDPYRGWLTSKDYCDSTTGNPPPSPGTTGPSYDYTAGGRVKTRLWLRHGTDNQRLRADYTYGFQDGDPNHGFGELVSISYPNDPQATPTVTYSYDRLGRQKAIGQGAANTILDKDDVGNIKTETYTGGVLDGFSVSRTFDQYFRPWTVSLVDPLANTVASTTYGYDAASRLKTVSDGPRTATYSYIDNSPLVRQILFQQSGVTRMTTTKSYDFLNRLTKTSSDPVGVSFDYTYDPLTDQRTTARTSDKSYWVYSYDAIGQVKSGKKYWYGGKPVAGQQFEYTFDDIGNRTLTGSGGDNFGSNLRYSRYSANALDQYTSRTPVPFVLSLGSANPNATVTLWGNDGSFGTTCRKDDYFSGELPLTSTGAVWLTLTNVAVLQNSTQPDVLSSVSGKAFWPGPLERFLYDEDGNLVRDGRWQYTWDAENRLISMQDNDQSPVVPRLKLDFVYDFQGRRIQKVVSTSNGSGWTVTSTTKFICDGWNLIAELGPANTVLRSYAWGLDLNGSLQGARGIAGLILMNDATLGAHFYAFDGNGNVAALASASDGTGSANYEYGPFGETLRATGPMATSSPFQFCTAYGDTETGAIYYGHRYYVPSVGRWISRDRFGETIDYNVYSATQNDPINRADVLGDYTLKLGQIGSQNLAATTLDVKITVTAVHLGSLGPTPPYKANCCCSLADAQSSIAVTIWFPSDVQAAVYQKPGLQDQVLLHEIAHATGDEKFAPIAIDTGLKYLKTHCKTRWLPGLTWTKETCMKAQQGEVDDLTKWIQKTAYGEHAKMAHNLFGANPSKWNPAGVPRFYAALDDWIHQNIKTDWPYNHFW